MSDLGLLVPHPTHLVSKWFSFGFSLSFDLESSFWILEYLFQAIFLFPPQGFHDLPYHGILRMGQSECKVLIRSFVCFFFSTCGLPSVVSTLLPPRFMCDTGAILVCLFQVSLSVLWMVGEKALMLLVTLAINQQSYRKSSAQLHCGTSL